MKYILLLLSLSLSQVVFVALPSLSLAQTKVHTGEADDKPDTLEDDEIAFKARNFVNLTIGIEQDVKLPPLPADFEFKGDFRRVTSASYSKQLNVIRFNPRSEGFATLTIHDKKNGRVVAEYRIDIKKSKLDKVIREMRALLGDIEGISIKIVNNRVVVDGQVLLPRDLGRIYSVVNQYGDQAATLVTMSPVAMKKIVDYIRRDINNPDISVKAVNDKIILEGEVGSEDEQKKAEIIAKMYLPDIVIDAAEEKGVIRKRKPANDGIINLITVKDKSPAPPPKMIQLVVHFVELNKEYGKSFKFQFTPSIRDDSGLQLKMGQSQDAGVFSEITATVQNLLPKLNWAKSHGHARILESTSLIVQDGKQGSLNQTTDFPIPVQGPNNTTTYTSAKVGLETAITPVILGEKSGSVKMDMKFKLSNVVDFSTGIPIVSSNDVVTTITVRDRQSAAIGGLIRNTASTGFNPPNGASDPIISLYASKNFQRKQSQFVVFITPIIKTSASAGSELTKKKFGLGQ